MSTTKLTNTQAEAGAFIDYCVSKIFEEERPGERRPAKKFHRLVGSTKTTRGEFTKGLQLGDHIYTRALNAVDDLRPVASLTGVLVPIRGLLPDVEDEFETAQVLRVVLAKLPGWRLAGDDAIWQPRS